MESETTNKADGQDTTKDEADAEDAAVEPTSVVLADALQPSQPAVPGLLSTSGGASAASHKRKDALPEAVDVATITASGTPATNPLALRHERLQGTITKFVASSSWGFLKSHLFEGELGFKMESIMPELQNYEFKDGEAVEFDVQADERGRPHAVALKPIVGRKANDCIGQRHRGYVRRFADRWGFLNAAAFDGDLFVHRDNLLLPPDAMVDGQPPLRSQQAVEFDVAVDDRGRTVAKQITTCALLRPADWIGRRLQGIIRSFQGAWGFINSDRFAGDLFVHRDSLLAQYQGVDLGNGTMVEFDVERDNHKKGGKNRLVARQVSVLQQSNPAAHSYVMPPQHPMMPQAHMPPIDPMAYGGLQPGMYPQAGFPPQPMYYHPGAPAMPPDQLGGALPYGQPAPHPFYPYDPQFHHPAPHQMMSSPPPQPLPPPQYGQPLPQYGAQPGQPMPGQAPYQPPLPAAAGAPLPGAAPLPGGAPQGMLPQASAPGESPAEGQSGEAAQVLLHITTHDWEPDQTQSGQLRVTKGTLVNVSHRAAHGWVYAATVKHGEQAHEPPSEGWVPQVWLCTRTMQRPWRSASRSAERLQIGQKKGQALWV
eukprot:TRINITY_DN4820_c0_g2_i1.p1 TRINITY_DN4820_c0_g2~~TRINITY_DN4820_c0_g2_i1.p1  ORF type:complete len:596 (+),score=105.10 TRINITY_DN4820_c0_g2_i1:70-1857(+)